MYAPKVSKAQQPKATGSSTKSLAGQSSALTEYQAGPSTRERALMLQRTIGNQARLRLSNQQTTPLVENRPDGNHEQGADPADPTAQRPTPAVAWDLSKISVFSPAPYRTPFPLSAPPLPGIVQSKLIVGEVDDPLERDADRATDQVMRMPDSHCSRTIAPLQLNHAHAVCMEGAIRRQIKTARSSEAVAGVAPGIVHEALRSAWRPLDETARVYFEPRFGHDLSSVRVHTGAAAERSAREVNARAYTVGNDIVFGTGQFSPGTHQGQALLAHELAHVVQQPDSDGRHPNTLRRKVIADVLSGSVGEFYAQQLTPEELRSETALVVSALRTPNLPDANRMLLEGNLKVLEEQSSAQGVELPLAAGYRLGQVIFALATDLKGLTGELLVIGKTEVGGSAVGSDVGFSPFAPELNWDLEELHWITDILIEAVGLASSGEGGGPQSAQQLRAAGAHVTAALFGFRGVATHMAYLHTGIAFASEGTEHTIASKVRNVREEIHRMLAPLRTLDPSTVEKAVIEIESPSFGFQTDFDSFVEELEEHERTWRRVGQIVNIVGLALTAGELAFSGGGGPAAMGGGTGFGGATVSGAAIARGAVGSLEWVEAMRRLATIGAISSAALGRLGGGIEPQPSKPIQSSASEPKPRAAPKASGEAAGGAKVDPAVDKAGEKGINEYEGPQTRPSKPPLRRPASNAASEAARTKFEKVRDGFAEKLGLPKGGQVHHAIELQVVDRFPGAFTEPELNSLENMRGVPPELEGKMQLHQSKIREVWNRHYREIEAEIVQKGLKPGTAGYRDLVRRAVTEHSREIDHLLGQFFSEEGAGRAVQGLSGS